MTGQAFRSPAEGESGFEMSTDVFAFRKDQHGQAIPMSNIEIDGKTHIEAWQILPKTED